MAGSSRRRTKVACIATALVLLAGSAHGEVPQAAEPIERKPDLSQLMDQLAADPERNPGETREEWYARIAIRVLDLSDGVLAHPDAAVEHRQEAIGRKLAALALLARRKPDQHQRQWAEFASQVVDEFPGTALAGTAARQLLEHRISENPVDPEIVAEISRFRETYPNSDRPAVRLYSRLAQALYARDRTRALEVLEGAIASLPPKSADALRQHKNRLTLVGSKLAVSFPGLNGDLLEMDELRGKVVLVYSWATWCAPCIEKFPMLKELHSKYHPHGFEIVAVSQDDAPSVVTEFLEGRDVPWICVMQSETYREQYGDMLTPGSLLIDGDGIVVSRGILTRAEIESAIQRTLAAASDRQK